MNKPSDLQSEGMARPLRRPTSDDRAHLAAIRIHAATALTDALRGSPDPSTDLLGALAWYHVIVGPQHVYTVELIDRALEDRYSWAHIAGACGVDPDNRTAVQVFMQGHRRRQRG